MATPNFPEVYVVGLQALLALDNDALEYLTSKLSKPDVYLRIQDLNDAVGSVPGLDRPALNQLLLALTNLRRMADELSLPKLLKYVESSLVASEGTSQLSPDQHVEIVRRLDSLLESGLTLQLFTKANDIIADDQKLFLNCRIISEIRPVFNEITKPPLGAAILHTLKIIFSEDFQQKEFFVTLDLNDLQVLADQIERAFIKTDSLASELSKSNVVFINPKETTADAII